MNLTYINPNATEAMTRGVIETARAALPSARITGLTNSLGPAAIQGPEDGAAAVPGLLGLLPEARSQGAEAIVIACFDDTGLTEANRIAGCPVLGIGQSSYVMATLLGLRFSVVTSLAVSVPVIRQNIHDQGFDAQCVSVRASGLPVLTIDAGAPETLDRIADEIALARAEDKAQAVVLGCAGMARFKALLEDRTGLPMIDGVAASAFLAQAALGALGRVR
jgi:allantoin racemase